MIYFCCEEKRRSLVRSLTPASGVEPPNGIDYLEVVDSELANTSQESLRQRRLRVFFVRPPAGALLARLSPVPPLVRAAFSGGQRTTGIRAELVTFDAPRGMLEITVDRRGDFSPYTLALLEPDADQPLAELDRALAAVDFSFKVECPSPFDCAAQQACAPEQQPAPEIDYLAKDYASFRQLMLDRLATILPDWRERNPADLGVTLVEVLAYVGDYLSYRQDAVATEAYLGTARQRASVRRHTRLLDYSMHDGCNARAWVQLRVRESDALGNAAPTTGIELPRLVMRAPQNPQWRTAEEGPVPGSLERVRHTRFVTRVRTDEPALSEKELARLVARGAVEVFEPLDTVRLFAAHNEIRFYTWSSDRCCLPRGAVKATLRGNYPDLKPGAVIVLAEMRGPKTGETGDADPLRRHAVRLVDVGGGPTDPVTGEAITEISWSEGDALPWPLCISSVDETDGRHISDVSVALGNIVLADHGMTRVEPQVLEKVPQSDPALAPALSQCGDACADREPALAPPRYNPRLSDGPLTQAGTIRQTRIVEDRRVRQAYDPNAPAVFVFDWNMEDVLPAIRLGDGRGGLWLPQHDLLSSDAFAPEFVAEMQNDGNTALRFGDGENAMRPDPQTSFAAVYRTGNGSRGNVGEGAIAHIVLGDPHETGSGDAALADITKWIAAVTNPLAARGGIDAESLERARQMAPAAFREPRRAVTPEDYARMAETLPGVQRAAATLRWTGSWHTVFLTVDRHGARTLDEEFEERLRRYLEPLRMAGHDLEIDGPEYVALELELMVCIEPHYFRSDVLAALHEVFGNAARADGKRGFFHPDNFTFGQPVVVSRIYAAAQAVAGVQHVELVALQRLGTSSAEARDTGALGIGRLEIARLDNDRNFPDRGVLRFDLKGGRR